MTKKTSDILGQVEKLPKKITDVTESISKGAAKLDTMVSKMDDAVKSVPTNNPVSTAVKNGLSGVTGALSKGTHGLNQAASNIQVVGTKVSTKITPFSTAVSSIQESLTQLRDCQEVFVASSYLVDAVVGSVSGHFHPRANEKAFSSFDEKWDAWANMVNTTFSRLSPSSQGKILETLGKSLFGNHIYALGSAVKNEVAGVFGGIADFENALHAFRGSYRNPVEAAKKIETGVKSIVNATERVANSVNGMIKRFQSEMGMNPTGSKILDYLGNLHDTKVVSAINKTLTLGGGAATLFTDVQGIKGALKSKDPNAILAAGKKTVQDAKNIIKGLKNNSAAQQVTPLAQSPASTSSATNKDATDNQSSQQDNPSQESQEKESDQQQNKDGENQGLDSANADSYVCSGAIMRCTFGDKQSRLTVYPDRTVYLTDQPMANISDHISLYNIAPFGKCRTLGYPATAAATAANQGKLTPMPCIPGTLTDWQQGKNDYIIKGDPALLKSSFCRCCYGGIITIKDDGQK